MTASFINIICLAIGSIGLAFTILFWIPGIVNRNRLKEIMDKKYPLVYVVYFANGPFLVLLALLIYMISRNTL